MIFWTHVLNWHKYSNLTDFKMADMGAKKKDGKLARDRIVTLLEGARGQGMAGCPID